jgi:GDP-D-mannose 3', 5'-epimerase
MKICVTGGAGMIGSTLVRKLINLGYEISVIDNLWRGKLENLNDIDNFNINNDFHNVDLSDNTNVETITRIVKHNNIVIHLADLVAGISYVFDNQYDIFRINNAINTNLFHACALAGVPKMIYVGTACSFPKSLQRSLTSVLREDQLFPSHPESSYGWSKLMGTLELGFLSEKYGCNVGTLMLHNVYGPYCDLDPSRSQVIPSLIRKMIELPSGGSLRVWGSGNQGRAFIYVDDVVMAFVKAIEKDILPPVIQIGPSVCTSIKDLVYCLKDEILKKDMELVFDTSKPEGDLGRCADYSLAKAALGWEPKVSLSVGLQNTYRWIDSKLKHGM